MPSLSPIIAELERMYAEFAAAFDTFDAPAMLSDRPIISVASRGRKRTVSSWYVGSVWQDVTDDLLDALVGDAPDVARVQTKRAEIVIASELLRAPVVEIGAALARGMLCHALTLRGQTKWVPGESHYYPKEWRTIARAIGCTAEVNADQPAKGWSRFEADTVFVSTVTPILNASAFDLSRDAAVTKDAVGSRMLKYSCGCTTVRAAVALSAMCERCHRAFRWAESFLPPLRFVQSGCSAYQAFRVVETQDANGTVTGREVVTVPSTGKDVT